MLHAGQGTTAAPLMAGKPVLNIPLVLEQRLTANAVPARRTGAGPAALLASSCDEVGKKLERAAGRLTVRAGNAARRVAEKYCTFDAAAQVRRMVERVEGLMEVEGTRAMLDGGCSPGESGLGVRPRRVAGRQTHGNILAARWRIP